MAVYSQINVDTPEANVIFASGIFCSSRSDAMDLYDSVEQDFGIEGEGQSKPGNTSLILPVGHKNSNSVSLSSSFSIPSSSVKKKKKKKNPT